MKRFSLAYGNAACICIVANFGFVVGSAVWYLVVEHNPCELFLLPELILACNLLPGQERAPGFFFVLLLLVSILAPALVCIVSSRINRKGPSALMNGLLLRTIMLGLWSVLLTALVTTPIVMLLDQVFTQWSIVYTLTRLWLAPLIYLLALAIVQLILSTEEEFVLSKFCSISPKEEFTNPGFICAASFIGAILSLLASYFLTPSYHGPLFRDPATSVLLFEGVSWLLAGLCLVRILNLNMYVIVYFSCFVLPTLYVFNVLPAVQTCICIH
ncbi:MAG: hypothetical protein WC714_19920 [Candidatus Obscuribacterales bacterium]